MNEMDILSPQPRKVHIGGKEVLLKPLTNRGFRDLISEVFSLLERFAAVHPETDVTKFDAKLLTLLLKDFANDLNKIASLLLENKFTPEEIDEQMTLAEWLDFAEAVWEVNALDEVIRRFFGLRKRISESIGSNGQQLQKSFLQNTEFARRSL